MTNEQQKRLDEIFDRLRMMTEPEDMVYVNNAQEKVEDLIEEIEEFYKG
jgi:hypothetical protein